MNEYANIETVKKFWRIFDDRNYAEVLDLLHEEFEAYWVCTRERFNREDFIEINEEYPGRWRTIIDRIFSSADQVVTFVHVFSPDSEDEHYASSIFTLEDGKIIELEEYWSPVGEAPSWREHT